jgi:hypothetical protein
MESPIVPVKKIKDPTRPGQFLLVNASDFDAATMEEWTDPPAPKAAPEAPASPAAPASEASAEGKGAGERRGRQG